MSFNEKCNLVSSAKATMESSKALCLSDAVRHFQCGNEELANIRLEKAAQYAWGFNRPKNWN
jgi:hypothetical protein